ncbi:MAG: hypothetical protein ABUL66_01690, partial [Verrucomicrobiota bacterium]
MKTQNILSAAIFTAMTCAFAAFPVRGQSAYLEVAGPPPLRFAAKMTNGFLLASRFPLRQSPPEPAAVSNVVMGIPASTETNAEVVKISVPTNAIPPIPSVPLTLPATNQPSVLSVSSGENIPADTS